MPDLVQLAINQGVPQETIVYILMYPIILTIIAAARQVVGIKAFGIYTPSIIAVALLATTLKYGIAIFIVILAVALGMRFVLKSFKLLYMSRTAIMLSVVAVAVLAFLAIGGSLQRTGLASVSIFPLLIMITIVEKFVIVQMENGYKTALMLAFETIFLAAICYFFVKWEAFQSLILDFPGIVVLIVILNIALGKWTGLRLSEYYRFRDVISNVELPRKK
ncbi:MAG: 7TM domain-containing protein [Candidatus Moraniibacteriota bacterium]